MGKHKIKEIFSTLQGEGAKTGMAAIFCRFTGCNLWSGKEEHRAKSACRFCDTDFVGMDGTLGGRYTSERLIALFLDLWSADTPPIIVFTGGEPALQLDEALVQACKDHAMTVCIETNGTRSLPIGIDWVTLSPKPRTKCLLQNVSELKLIYPQPEDNMAPHNFDSIEAEHFFLQPMDGPNLKQNTLAAIEYCQQHPKWRLSLQTHKMIGLR